MRDGEAYVLIVEDDAATAELVRRALRRAGFGVNVAHTLDAASLSLIDTIPSVVVLDFNIQSLPAWPILEVATLNDPPVPVVMFTAMGDERVASEAIKRGAADYVIKTGDFVRRLIQSVENAVRAARAERALQQMQAWQSAILGSVGAQLVLLDKSGSIILANDAWKQSFGGVNVLAPGFGVGSDYSSIIESVDGMDPDSAQRVVQGTRAVLDGQAPNFTMEYSRRAAQSRHWYRLDVSPLKHEQEKGAVVMHVDITDRVLAEEARLQNAELLQSILQSVNEGILVSDSEGCLVQWNVAAEKILGMDMSDLSRAWRDQLRPHPDDANLVAAEGDFPLVDALAGKVVFERELCITHPEGRALYLSASAHPLPDKSGNIRGAVTTFRDITERRAREIEIRRIAAAVQQTADAIIITDTDGRIEYVNPAFESMYGYRSEEVHGDRTSMLRSGAQDTADYEALWEVLQSGQTWTGRFTNVTKAGDTCIVDATISPVRDDKGITHFYVASERDISAQVAMESQLRQSQKMEAIGVLAGGIAHDFNNILAAIDGYTRMAITDLDDKKQVHSDLSQVLVAADRAKYLIRQILTFSRKTATRMERVELDSVITESVELMRATLPSSIQIRARIECGGALVLADQTQLQQVIVNLITNGGHAIGDEGGLLSVRLSTVTIDEENLIPELEVPAGRYAIISVEDNGHGIEESILARIFDPFFSTKEKDIGTGLGLSTTLGIVKEHQGAIAVTSEIDRGTTFQVYLPLVERGEPRAQVAQEKKPPRGNGEHILVVDDELSIAKLSGRMLTNLGYRVTVRNSPQVALEDFRAAPHEFDAVLTDLTMPEIRGDRLARAIFKIRPEIPIVLLSGYAQSAKLENLGLSRILAKPVQIGELATAFAEALAKPKT